VQRASAAKRHDLKGKSQAIESQAIERQAIEGQAIERRGLACTLVQFSPSLTFSFSLPSHPSARTNTNVRTSCDPEMPRSHQIRAVAPLAALFMPPTLPDQPLIPRSFPARLCLLILIAVFCEDHQELLVFVLERRHLGLEVCLKVYG